MIDFVVTVGVHETPTLTLSDGMGVDHRLISLPLERGPVYESFTPTVHWRRPYTGPDDADFKRRLVDKLQATDLDMVMTSPPPDRYARLMSLLDETGAACLGRTRRQAASLSFEPLPWWSAELSRLSRCYKLSRKAMWRARGSSLTPSTVTTILEKDYKAARGQWRRSVRAAKDAYWRLVRSQMSRSCPQDVIDAFGFYKRLRNPISTLEHDQEDFDVAWSGIISKSPPQDCSNVDDSAWMSAWLSEHTIDRISSRDQITVSETRAVLDMLPARKAAGEDAISNAALKCLPAAWITALTTCFNDILSNPAALIPARWKSSVVCLLQKKTQPSPLDYRPITLLSCVAKTLETILLNRLYLDMVPLHLHRTQGGFRHKRGCHEQVWLVCILDQYLLE